jgi:hypothetical protein
MNSAIFNVQTFCIKMRFVTFMKGVTCTEKFQSEPVGEHIKYSFLWCTRVDHTIASHHVLRSGPSGVNYPTEATATCCIITGGVRWRFGLHCFTLPDCPIWYAATIPPFSLKGGETLEKHFLPW